MKKPTWKTAFLDALAQNGNVSRSVQSAQISRAEVYRERADNAAFAQSWEDALDAAGDLLEEEARRRACEGVEKPVFYKGAECGTVRDYSDTLLIFLLKGAKPHKYKEIHRQEHTGAGGTPIRTHVEVSNLRDLPAEELVRLYRDRIEGE